MGHIGGKGNYLALQQRLDKNPVGAPPKKELFEILKELFTDEECAVAAAMPLKLSTARTIAKRGGMTEAKVEEVMKVLVPKGLVVDIPLPGRPVHYFLNPTVIGFFEFSMMRVRKSIDQKKIAKLLWDYIHEDPDHAFMRMVADGQTFIARPMVNEERLEPEIYSEVLDYEKASLIVERSDLFAEGMCHCRHVMSHLDKKCDLPENFCLSFGKGARYLIEAGISKPISKERAMDVIQEARELGMVQMADNVKNEPTFICNCCKCCCEMMYGLRTIPDAPKVVSSNYVAVIDEQACNGCKKCTKACPVDAIDLIEATPTDKAKKRKRRAVVDSDRCLGCAVCAKECKFDALSIRPLPARVYTPDSLMEKMMMQALEKGKLQHILFDNPDKITHRALNTVFGAMLNLPPAKKLLAKQQIRSKFVEILLDGFKKTSQGWMSKV